VKTRNLKIFSAAAMTATLLWANSIQAAIVTPAGLNPGDNFYVVFVTADSTDASSADITTYDTFAQTEADNGGLDTYNSLPVTWEALGSTDSVNANSRFPTDLNAPIYLIDGTEVAANGAAFWGTSGGSDLLNPIDIDSNGYVEDSQVWTGSFTDGTEAYELGPKGLGDQDDGVGYGDSSAQDNTWIAEFFQSPVDSDTGDEIDLPIYAFSSELTVPVPSPSAGGLAIGVLALEQLAARRLLKRRPQ
jgi:hypothetical protein